MCRILCPSHDIKWATVSFSRGKNQAGETREDNRSSTLIPTEDQAHQR